MLPRLRSQLTVDWSHPYPGGTTATVYPGSYGGRDVAVKRFKHGPEYAEIALHENQMMERLHPDEHVAHELGLQQDHQGDFFLITERAGSQLSPALWARARREPTFAVAVLMNLLRGLRAVHQSGVVHRDLHAGNFLLQDGKPRTLRVIDFSHAEPIGAMVRCEPWEMQWYLPPERKQVGAVLAMRPQGDLFTAACVGWRLLTGHAPFTVPEGHQHDLAAWNAAYARGPHGGEGLAPGLRAVQLKGLVIDPAQRVQTAQDFINALRPFGPVRQP